MKPQCTTTMDKNLTLSIRNELDNTIPLGLILYIPPTDAVTDLYVTLVSTPSGEMGELSQSVGMETAKGNVSILSMFMEGFKRILNGDPNHLNTHGHDS